MNHIFISHVEEDEPLAIDLARGLESSGFSTWYYERDIVPGPAYLSQVGQAIDSASAVALIISPNSIGSNQVTGEVVRALESGKPFIPLRHGISHIEFQTRQPVWRQALAAAASIPIPDEGIQTIISRIAAGLMALGIKTGKSHRVKTTKRTSASRKLELPTGARSKLSVNTDYQVFISCTSKLGSIEQGLAALLKSHGYKVFSTADSNFQKTEIQYANTIDLALESSKALIVIGTEPGHFDSGWIGYEWRSFLNEIRSGRKPPETKLLSLVGHMNVNELPHSLRSQQVVKFDISSPETGYNEIMSLLDCLPIK